MRGRERGVEGVGERGRGRGEKNWAKKGGREKEENLLREGGGGVRGRDEERPTPLSTPSEIRTKQIALLILFQYNLKDWSREDFHVHSLGRCVLLSHLNLVKTSEAVSGNGTLTLTSN